MAVTEQPGFGKTGLQPGVCHGLEYIANLEEVIVKKSYEKAEVLTSPDLCNMYDILDPQFQRIFHAFEESEACHRYCWGPQRGFIFHVQDNNHKEVLTVKRDPMCCVGCACCADSCCGHPVNVYDGLMTNIGMMRSTNACCSPPLSIFDESDNKMFWMNVKCCPCQASCCPEDIIYPIFSAADESCAGNITKEWAGKLTEMMNKYDIFKITFPKNLSVKQKALFISSVFLLDMKEYREPPGIRN